MLEEYNKAHGFALPPALVEVIFAAADDDGTSSISEQEFEDVCELLQYKIWTTYAESFLTRNCVWFRGSQLLERLKMFVFEDTSATNVSMTRRICNFGKLSYCMDLTLVLNFVLIVISSGYDLQDIDAPSWTNIFDKTFSIFYCVDVLLNLAVMSVGTYLSDSSSCFDFVTTLMVVATDVIETTPQMKTYINIFRTLRLVRLLRVFRFPHVQRIAVTISNMLKASSEVSFFFFLTLFMWGSWGVAFFGGRWDIENNEQRRLWNFDDLVNSVYLLTIMLLNGWWDDVFAASMECYTSPVAKVLISCFFLSFYVMAVLVVFNVFVAFAISAFKATSPFKTGSEAMPVDVKDVFAGALVLETPSMTKKREELRHQGTLIHMRPTADLVRYRINQEVFRIDEEEVEIASRALEQSMSEMSSGRFTPAGAAADRLLA